eukprot:9113387-Lingulodinium_polyedra.AAC.1
MGLFFLLEVDLGARFCEEAYCGDSSSFAYAVHVTRAKPQELREAWRWREKWRWLPDPAEAAPPVPETDPDGGYVQG